ncbi:MAG: LysR family transcriptional regulator [Alphaproteobacteria bacterium]|nr:LysR family transcriptional regulator [Alphaproteobacteria bacterium]
MELRHLRYFVAVAEESHITRAAEKLGIQQPPLSQQIKALETELDVQLFRRKPRGVELTDAGRLLLEDARQILEKVEHARAATQRTARGEQGRIVAGFTSSAPFHPLVPRVIRSFREATPLVSMQLEEAGTGTLVEGLRNETLDVAFIRSPVSDVEGIAVHPLIEEDMVVALHAGHRIAAEGDEEPIALEALASEPFILYRRSVGPGLHDAIITACNGAGFTPDVAQEAPRITSTLNLVAAGLGVSLVPDSLRRLQMDGISYRCIRQRPALKAPLNLACRRVENSIAVRRFIDMTRLAAAAFPVETV